ncbi:MAG: hypothetical protein Aureis2KO_05500 [Aureisphaera sp.]
MKKIKILICDDQEADHMLVKLNFIENTFFKDNVDLDSFYFFELAPKDKGIPFMSIDPNDFDYDIVFLDLNFIPEGIQEEDEKDGVIDKALIKLKSVEKDILLLILSKDGGNRSDSLTVQGVPIIDKNANQNVIKKFLMHHYDRFVRSKIAGCSYDEIHSIREDVSMGNSEISIAGENYITSSLFSHISPKEYYSIFHEIPNLKEDDKFKFELDLGEYFKELIGNPKWREEEKKWEKRLRNLILAYLLSSYCEISSDVDDNFAHVVANSLLVWDTSIVKNFNTSGNAIPTFIKRLNTRRLIAFLYLVCNYSQKNIYWLLKGTKDDPGDKTIENGFRYSYFLFKTSALPEISRRKKTYHLVRNQLFPYDKKLLKNIGNEFLSEIDSLECNFETFDRESFKSELNNLG